MIATHGSLPRYVLATPSFRFRALASLAGRAALGGPREVALATYVAARLAHDCLPSRALPPSIRVTRAGFARTWMSSLSLPAPIRTALSRLTESTESELEAVSTALRVVITETTTYLDAAARTELERLASMLDAS